MAKRHVDPDTQAATEAMLIALSFVLAFAGLIMAIVAKPDWAAMFFLGAVWAVVIATWLEDYWSRWRKE